MSNFAMVKTVSGNMAEVRERCEAALKEQGFGILTEIDVQKTLKEKIDVDFEGYVILGACNPALANQALAADRSVGLLLPCNVTLREISSGIEVAIADPDAMFRITDEATRQRLAPLVEEAKSRLSKALANV